VTEPPHPAQPEPAQPGAGGQDAPPQIGPGPIGPGGRRPNPASAERTRLSWRRTALSQTVCALLFVRLASTAHPVGLAALAGGLAMLGWVVTLAIGQRRITAMNAKVPVNPRRSLPITAAFVVELALVGTLLVVLP
jgi:uncharacterized membrane protein YidH (DUF202 family)